MELLLRMALHVPYRGSGPSITDTIAGRARFHLRHAARDTRPYPRRKLRAVAVTTKQRHPALPELPTVAEAGGPGYEAVGWYGLADAAFGAFFAEDRARWGGVILTGNIRQD